MGYHLTSPSKCSFELYLIGRGLWGVTDSYSAGGNVAESDPVFALTHRKAESYVLSRLMFDSPKARSANSQYSVYNPYTVLTKEEESAVPLGLFSDEDEEKGGDDHKTAGNAGLEELKKLLNVLHPYTTYYYRFHNEIMDFPEATHEMFQKSVCNEVLFYYCKNNTNEYTLGKMVMAVNAMYMGWEETALPRMIEKYTGKQYAAIVPRGFGKTKTIRNVAATLLVTFPGIEVLTLAHRKALTCSTRDDIVSTLTTCFPADQYGHYKLERHQDCVFLVRDDGSPRACLKYASSLLSDSLRGYDCPVVLQDEFLCLPLKSYSAVNAMSQRQHCKVGYLSSPITDRKDRLVNLVRGLDRCGGVNIYRLCLFCLDPEHVQYSTTHTGCYRSIYTPNHIVYSSDNKGFESLLTQTEASFENEQGVIRPSDLVVDDDYDEIYTDAKTQFSRGFISRLCDPEAYVQLPSIDAHGPGDAVYWVYMDPAFHPTRQSAMAICCLRVDRKNNIVLVYMDRKFLTHKDLGRAGEIMEQMYSKCVSTVVAQTHPNTACHFFLAIERNINPDAARGYYRTWGDQSAKYPVGKTSFMYYVDMYNKAGAVAYGYLVDQTKKTKCDMVIHLLNKGHLGNFLIATSVEWGHYTRDTSIIEHFTTDVKNFQTADGCTGKVTRESTDDCVFCFLMGVHLACVHNPTALRRVANAKREATAHCTPPWITPRCQCPLTK